MGLILFESMHKKGNCQFIQGMASVKRFSMVRRYKDAVLMKIACIMKCFYSMKIILYQDFKIP